MKANRVSILAHGPKHRDIADSKYKASGGRPTEQILQRYDHETPLVKQLNVLCFHDVLQDAAKKGRIKPPSSL